MSNRKSLGDVMPFGRLLCVPPETTVALAARKMAERRLGAVVITRAGVLVGIVTERDIAFRLVARGRDAATTTLSEIMTANPDALPQEARIVDAMALMQANDYRHVPVVDGDRVVGMISMRDLFPEVRRELHEDIQSRREYMFGSGYSMPVAG